MAWLNELEAENIVHGDRPYGNFWTEIPDRPSPFAVWDGTQWMVDEKLAHNEPIDAEISAFEAAQILPRVVREYMLVDAVNTVLIAQGINVATATGQQRAAALAALTTPGSSLYSLGIAKLKAFDDNIVALRATRLP